MTTSSQALNELVSTLVESTKAGRIEWEQVDAQGRTFLASRRGGTVLLSGPSGTSGIAAMAMASPVTIEVKNSAGTTIEKGENSILGAAIGTTSVRGLTDLWRLVGEQRTQAASAIQTLAEEFKS